MTKGSETIFIPGKTYPMHISQFQPKMEMNNRKCAECNRWKAISSFTVEGTICKYCRFK